MKHYEVVAAVICRDDKYLCVQKGGNKYDYISYKYEFPGGKIEVGETQEEALIREIKEELNYNIKVISIITTVNYKYADFEITLYAYLCKADNDAFTLKEHIAYTWLPATQLSTLDWAQADWEVVSKIEKAQLKIAEE